MVQSIISMIAVFSLKILKHSTITGMAIDLLSSLVKARSRSKTVNRDNSHAQSAVPETLACSCSPHALLNVYV